MSEVATLLDDAEVTRCVATLQRVAHQLEHVALVSRASMARGGSLTASVVASTADARTPLRHTTRRDDATMVVPSSPSHNATTATLAADVAAASDSALQLPKSCGADTVAVLGELGRQLREALQTLLCRVEQQFVDFYEHMKRHELGVLQELATQRRIAPSGFDMYTDDTHSAGGSSNGVCRLRTPTSATTATVKAAVLSQTTTGDAVLQPVHMSATAAATTDTATTARLWSATGGDATLTRSWRDGVATLHNAPLARRLNERRVAANTMQTFLYLLLEGALTQTDAMCAAVYLCGSDDSNTSNSSGGGGGGDGGAPALSTCRAQTHAAASRAATPRTTTPPLSSRDGTTSRAADADGQQQQQQRSNKDSASRRFLHCVASLNAQGRLPQDVSLASLSTLAIVVQTGVAANLQASGLGGSNVLAYDTAHGNNNGNNTNTAAAAAAARHAVSVARKGLDITTGVIVPIRNYGCVVLANKRLAGLVGSHDCSSGSSSALPRSHADLAEGFSVSDEHVAWSVALACEALLARYERELLLDFAWAPSGVAALRRHMKLARVSECATDTLPRLGKRAGGNADVTASEPLLLLPLPSLVADKTPRRGRGSRVGSGGSSGGTSTHTPLSRALTIVRTTDARLRGVLPEAVLRSANRAREHATPHTTAAPATAAPATTLLCDEDLFSAAAQYIANLESLWSQSLSENNTMQNVLARFAREMEAKNDTIRALEGKIRRLNAHIVQLERRVTSNVTAGAHGANIDGT